MTGLPVNGLVRRTPNAVFATRGGVPLRLFRLDREIRKQSVEVFNLDHDLPGGARRIETCVRKFP
jgi:hypothetical protein